MRHETSLEEKQNGDKWEILWMNHLEDLPMFATTHPSSFVHFLLRLCYKLCVCVCVCMCVERGLGLFCELCLCSESCRDNKGTTLNSNTVVATNQRCKDS